MEQQKTPSYIRIVRILLFAALPVIDCIRTSTVIWQMMLASQCIGTILAIIIILHYGIKTFLKWRNLLWFLLCAILIATMPYWFYAELIKYHFLYEMQLALFNMSLYGIIVSTILWDKIKADKKYLFTKIKSLFTFSHLPFMLWFGFILWATMMKDNTERPEFDLLYFGIFYLITFHSDELKELFDDLSNGILCGFWAVQGFAFVFRPYVDAITRYPGMYSNSNLFDCICLMVLILSLIKLTDTRRKHSVRHWKYMLFLLNCGAVLSLIVMSIGRTTIATALFMIAFYGILILAKEKDKFWKNLFLRALHFLVAFVIAFILVFISASYIPKILKHPIPEVSDYWVWGDLEDDDNYVSVEELLNASLGRFAAIFVDYDTPKTEISENQETIASEPELPSETIALDPDGPNQEYYLPEEYNSFDLRYAIWREYMDEFNLSGHVYEDWIVWVAIDDSYQHAHNIFIMLAFIYGIPSGLLFLGWMISYILLSGKAFLRHYDESMKVAPAFIWLGVVLFGMFDCCWMYGQLSWFLLLFLFKFISNETCKTGIDNK